MQFSSDFNLNREHFSECFEQSELLGPVRNMRYKFIVALLIIGFLIMMFSSYSVSMGLLFIGLAFLEFFSFKYRKTWWLTRQMWSKNGGNTITLHIDDNGIKIDSIYQKQTIQWTDISEVIETPKGIMIKLTNGPQSYLSKSSLSSECIDFIKSQTVDD